MSPAKRIRERGEPEEIQLLNHVPQTYDDGPEFSSEPMPAAFSACLFLACTLLSGVLLAILW